MRNVIYIVTLVLVLISLVTEKKTETIELRVINISLDANSHWLD